MRFKKSRSHLILFRLVSITKGPVLSFTGAIGGCSLAYIGPGLAYLGVHSDAFLSWVTGALDSRNNKASTTTTDGDLPIEGDANANMETTLSAGLSGPKPWWWWPLLMPLWVSIATKGSKGMNERLTAFDSEHGPVSPEHGNGDENEGSSTASTQVIEPCKRDYMFSVFFIFFGVVAMVAGVLSNVYVQVNNIFYTPT